MTTKQRERIEQHGRNLLAIFPNATIQDPIELCRRLRRIEVLLSRIATSYCNGEIDTNKIDEQGEIALNRVKDILSPEPCTAPIFFNRDPRGYALKVDDTWQREQKAAGKPYIGHEDWGGYGIIAPEINKDGN